MHAADQFAVGDTKDSDGRASGVEVDDVPVVGREHRLSREDTFSDTTNQRPYDVSSTHVDQLQSATCWHVQTKPAVRRTLTGPVSSLTGPVWQVDDERLALPVPDLTSVVARYQPDTCRVTWHSHDTNKRPDNQIFSLHLVL